MRFFAACLCSAILGSLFTVWLVDHSFRPQAVAQETNPSRQPLPLLRSPAPAQQAANPTQAAGEIAGRDVTAYFNDDGLSPEEAINVAVYERLHKSVVNITTRSVRVQSFFATEQSRHLRPALQCLFFFVHLSTVVASKPALTISILVGFLFNLFFKILYALITWLSLEPSY